MGSPYVPFGSRLRLFTKTGLFPGGNIQVTSGSSKEARSESVVAVNPLDSKNIIAASKKFNNPQTYRFTIGLRVSFDGGWTWQDSVLPTLPGWGDMVGSPGVDPAAGMTDPAVAFDSFGNAFMVGEPIKYAAQGEIDTTGMFVYKSVDGGLSWSAPSPLHVGDRADDKSWIVCDNSPWSPYYGRVYVVWGAVSPLRFSRSLDHGVTWKGVGNVGPATQIAGLTFAPEVSIGLDGTIHIVWFPDNEDGGPTGSTIEYLRSTDGGETFEKQRSIVTGVHGLRGNLPETNGWPHFPGATFRVMTLATGCGFGYDPIQQDLSPIVRVYGPKKFIVAWSDFREGAARIYYRTSSDAGSSFDGPNSGLPLLGTGGDKNLHHFHPQIVSTGNGIVGCAYYEYGPKLGGNRIDVKLTASFDKAQSFPYTVTVTDRPWDPSIDAPFSHGDSAVTFIGEYFGLDADETGFDVLWTDTRTGVQELFFDRVTTEKFEMPEIFKGISAEILFGVTQGGGGLILINGHIIRIPPRGPIFDLVQAIVALDAAKNIGGGASRRKLTESGYDAVAAIAKDAGKTMRF